MCNFPHLTPSEQSGLAPVSLCGSLDIPKGILGSVGRKRQVGYNRLM